MADTPGYPPRFGWRAGGSSSSAAAPWRPGAYRPCWTPEPWSTSSRPTRATEIREAAGAGRLRWRQRRFQPRDVLEPEPAWLVHAATDSPAVNAAVATACDEHRVWCVRADDADAVERVDARRGPRRRRDRGRGGHRGRHRRRRPAPGGRGPRRGRSPASTAGCCRSAASAAPSGPDGSPGGTGRPRRRRPRRPGTHHGPRATAARRGRRRRHRPARPARPARRA